MNERPIHAEERIALTVIVDREARLSEPALAVWVRRIIADLGFTTDLKDFAPTRQELEDCGYAVFDDPQILTGPALVKAINENDSADIRAEVAYLTMLLGHDIISYRRRGCVDDDEQTVTIGFDPQFLTTSLSARVCEFVEKIRSIYANAWATEVRHNR